ncbi:MAG: hypothetical protein V8Q79_01760 [Christensenellales bacterium]
MRGAPAPYCRSRFFRSQSVTKNHQDRQSLVENTIRNYAVQCYALEGFYPGTLQYLEDNYTLELNRKQYVYHYRFIGSNMMPEISVFEKEK